MEIDVNLRDGLIEIALPPPQGRLVREGSLLVWEPAAGVGTVSTEEILKLIEDARESRLDEITRGSGL